MGKIILSAILTSTDIVKTIQSASVLVVGQGTAQSKKRPNIDSSVYSWKAIDWDEKNNAIEIEYWIDPPPSTDDIF
jgi:flavorubredoxin